MHYRILFTVLAAFAAAVSSPAAPAPQHHPLSAAARSYAIAQRDGPTALVAFLRDFPKGADLHNHLSGAVYAESFVQWASEGGLCVNAASLTLEKPPCDIAQGRPPVVDYLRRSDAGPLLNALSMRGNAGGTVADHDQFFATFGRFGEATTAHFADELREIAVRADRENIVHLELMSSFGSADVSALAEKLAWSDDFNAMKTRLDALGLPAAVAAARAELAKSIQSVRTQLACDRDASSPGCRVNIGFLAQINRGSAPSKVFTQAMFAAALARSEPRVLGIDIVGPEDGPVALRDYRLHMRIIAYAAGNDVRASLHAGEMTLKLAPPEDLADHIRQAVETGHARRIGHGSDIAYETGAPQLLRQMRDRNIAVELALTSNEQILGLDAGTSPFNLYRRYGVPIALSTDDAGVERTTLTREYAKAAEWFNLSYVELKKLSIDSLRYSFLQGEDLWSDASGRRLNPLCAKDAPGRRVSGGCAGLLRSSERARAERELMERFEAFERGF